MVNLCYSLINGTTLLPYYRMSGTCGRPHVTVFRHYVQNSMKCRKKIDNSRYSALCLQVRNRVDFSGGKDALPHALILHSVACVKLSKTQSVDIGSLLFVLSTDILLLV